MFIWALAEIYTTHTFAQISNLKISTERCLFFKTSELLDLKEHFLAKNAFFSFRSRPACIDADFYDEIRVGKLSTRKSTSVSTLTRKSIKCKSKHLRVSSFTRITRRSRWLTRIWRTKRWSEGLLTCGWLVVGCETAFRVDLVPWRRLDEVVFAVFNRSILDRSWAVNEESRYGIFQVWGSWNKLWRARSGRLLTRFRRIPQIFTELFAGAQWISQKFLDILSTWWRCGGTKEKLFGYIILSKPLHSQFVLVCNSVFFEALHLIM